MKVAILGCGAIGSLFLGYLSEQGRDVTGVVKDYQKEVLDKKGLIIENVKGVANFKVRTAVNLNEKPDIVVLATKINDLEKAINDNIENLKDAIIVSIQNGIKAERIINNYFSQDKIISGIVMFGATFYAPNKVTHNFGKDLVLGNIFGAETQSIDQVKNLFSGIFETTISHNIKGAKYLKLFINLNNCIPAALGVSIQKAFADLDCARLAIRLNREAYAIVKNSDTELEDLPTYPKNRIDGLVSMELEQAAGLFSKIMISPTFSSAFLSFPIATTLPS